MTAAYYENLQRLPANEDSNSLARFVAPASAKESGAKILSIPANSMNATKPNQPYLQAAIETNIRDLFRLYAKQWSDETGGHSSLTMRKKHPAYKNIVDLGWAAVPHLLSALIDMPDFWFPALREITNINPVSPQDQGIYDKMVASWRDWGRSAGQIT